MNIKFGDFCLVLGQVGPLCNLNFTQVDGVNLNML